MEAHCFALPLRALAVASRKRLKTTSDVPTFVESGYPDFQAPAFFGTVTPPPRQKRGASPGSRLRPQG